MERLSFTLLSVDYLVESKYIIQSEEHYCSSFTCTVQLEAIYNQEDDNYQFTIRRSGVLLNGEKVSKLMDKIIQGMGSTLYPITLKVSPSLEILDVFNFDDIKLRRQKYVDTIMEKYPSNKTLRQYIDMGENNLINKKKMIRSLYQDSFFNLYFRNIYIPANEDEFETIVWVNFPKREMNLTYLYQVKPIDNQMIHALGEVMRITPAEDNGHYDITYHVGEYGEIHSVNGQISSSNNHREYVKEISIQQTKLKTSTAKWESIIL